MSWTDLPATVREAVTAECGRTIVAVEPAAAGVNSAIASTLRLSGGDAVFCKGVPVTAEGHLLAMYEREAGACATAAGLAPRLLWQVRTGGWWLLGFEHITGRAADFAPGSPDLAAIAQVLGALAEDLTPAPISVLDTLAGRLAPWQIWGCYHRDPPAGLPTWVRTHLGALAEVNAVVSTLTGHTLLHTDLNSHNWLIGQDRVAIIDWAWTCTGPAWAEAEWIAPRLVAAGHPTADVARWVDAIQVRHRPRPQDRLAFLATVAGIWQYRAREGGFQPILAEAALAWLQHRWTTTPTHTPRSGADRRPGGRRGRLSRARGGLVVDH